jgi:hypothetical protein
VDSEKLDRTSLERLIESGPECAEA